MFTESSLGKQNGSSIALLWKKSHFLTFILRMYHRFSFKISAEFFIWAYSINSKHYLKRLFNFMVVQSNAFKFFFCLSILLCVFHRILDHGWHGLLCRMLQWRRGLCWVRRTCRWARSVEFCLPLCGGLSFATEDQILKASPPPMDRKSVTSCPIQVPTHVHQYRDYHIVGYLDK